jgi:histidinol-phosphate phosphatase family protein
VSGAAPAAATLPADVVVPSCGRPSLHALLDALAAQRGPLPGRVVVVDDRPPGVASGLGRPVPAALRDRLVLVRSGGRGPAAARNAGSRACRAAWIAFLDDDVLVPADWSARLRDDLAVAGADVAGSQGRLRIPAPSGRRPTDWERNVAGLGEATWATADLAYRRGALEAAGGFDERFPRAYREDADLGLRLTAQGRRIASGRRIAEHPVPPAPPWVSLAKQSGNRDDALMRRLHGRGWRERARAPRGRIGRHTAVASAAALVPAALVFGRRRLAAVAAGAWLVGTAELAWARIGPGPRDRREVLTMLSTSAALPAVAAAQRLRGELEAPARVRRPAAVTTPLPEAVLFDRDGTLVGDVPYNGDPDRVRPMPGAREALDRLRAAGVAIGVVSNQSGIARGLVTADEVAAVNARVEALLGPFGTWAVCPHGPDDGCACRKPQPGLVVRAAAALGADPRRCVVVGDIGSDVDAGRAAGARGILVPTPLTRAEEVAAAPELAPDLAAIADLLLGCPAPRPAGHAARDVPTRTAVAA